VKPAAKRTIAFLRAINVGGHVVPMAKLAKLFAQLGLAEVETFIASGNVVFATPTGSPAALEKRIAAHLEKALGYEVATFLRTPAELGAVLEHRAFARTVPGATIYIGFLAVAPDAAATKRISELTTPRDDFHVHGRELYWRGHDGMGQSKVSGAKLEKALGQPVTFRNATTVGKLVAKYG